MTKININDYVGRNLVVVMRDREGRYFVENRHTLSQLHESLIHKYWDIVVAAFFAYVRETGEVLKDRAGRPNVNMTQEQADERVQYYLKRNNPDMGEELETLERIIQECEKQTPIPGHY